MDIMDADIKNLFQKFGKSGDAYKEINRDEVNEQARQRWPLLRDVHINSVPAYSVKKDNAAPLSAPPEPQDGGRPVAAATPDIQPGAIASPIFAPDPAPISGAPQTPDVGVSSHGVELVSVAPVVSVDLKDQSLSSVFGRLLGPQTETNKAESGTNSFFKKLFQP